MTTGFYVPAECLSTRAAIGIAVTTRGRSVMLLDMPDAEEPGDLDTSCWWRVLVLSPLRSFAIILLLTSTAWAGKYNPTLSIGDPAPKAAALTGTDDKPHSIIDEQEPKVTVLAFTCNTCPYAIDYEDRLNDLAKSLAEKPVRFIVVNSNSGKRDELDAMKERAEDKKFAFDYVKDEKGQVGQAFGATRTPEFFVLNREGKVVYLGAMDDDASGKNVKHHYVQDAIAAALAGNEPAVTETPPIGCNIKYARERQ